MRKKVIQKTFKFGFNELTTAVIAGMLFLIVCCEIN